MRALLPLLALPLALGACQNPRAGENVGEAREALVVCPGPVTLPGIDVSVYQGNIDWNQVKASGIVFAIARVDDGTYLDTKFDQNWAGMKAAGLIRGAYQFFEPGEDPNVLADIMINKMGPLGAGDLPPTLDMEVTGGQSAATITAHVHTWMDKVQAATGRVPIIYTGKYFWNDNVGSGDFAGNPLWLAAYVSPCPSTPDAWGGWSMWQYNDNGAIPGIAGNVDVDMFNGTIEQLNALASPPNKAPIGYLDSADCSSIAGWAQDQDTPDQPIDVHLYFDGNPGDPKALAFAVHADQHRDDLCQAIGSCNHGYLAAPPKSLLDGQPHTVNPFGIDSMGGNNPPLSGGPKTFQCAPPTPPVDALHGVKRWIASPAVFDAWRFDWFRDLAHEPDALVASFPDGPNEPDAPVVVQADDGTPEVWVIDTGVRRHVIDPASLAAWRLDGPGAIVPMPAAQVYGYPKGADLPAAPFVFSSPSDPKVYLLDVPLQPPSMGSGGSSGVGGGSAGTGDTSGSDSTGSVQEGSGVGGGAASTPDASASCATAPGSTGGSAAGLGFALVGMAIAALRRRSAIRG
jgi:GH25 family lysozyme M1 (1,4-beta-N-acetylmuramidase)